MKIGSMNYEIWQMALALLFAFVGIVGLAVWAPNFGVNWMNPASWVAFPGIVFIIAFLLAMYALWRQLTLSAEGFNLSAIVLVLFGIYALINMNVGYNWAILVAAIISLYLLHSNKRKFESCQPTLY